MTEKELLDYIMDNPGNTNYSVLAPMVKALANQNPSPAPQSNSMILWEGDVTTEPTDFILNNQFNQMWYYVINFCNSFSDGVPINAEDKQSYFDNEEFVIEFGDYVVVFGDMPPKICTTDGNSHHLVITTDINPVIWCYHWAYSDVNYCQSQCSVQEISALVRLGYVPSVIVKGTSTPEWYSTGTMQLFATPSGNNTIQSNVTDSFGNLYNWSIIQSEPGMDHIKGTPIESGNQ